MSLEHARTLLHEARNLAVLTGAGISAESGVPTFRGSTGLWKQFRPEELATPQAFARDPWLVWEWYNWRRGLISKIQPNSAHYALAELERCASRFALITQNVDGLHQQAGSKSVLEIHGSIWNVRCVVCGRDWIDRSVGLSQPPHCMCGGLARPGVVWFGESLPSEIWATAERATLSCDVFLMVGTSAVVYPAAGLAQLARSTGAKIIEITLEPTHLSELVDCSLIGTAGQILPEVIA